MYIAVEGIKGSGKSSLVYHLEEKLKQIGIPFTSFSPTRAMPDHLWWEKAYCYFSNDLKYIEDLYHARANYHGGNTDFSSSLIISDRSIITSFVTRWNNDLDISSLRNYIKFVESQEFLSPIPDIVIYLDIPIQVSLERLANRERTYGKHDETIERLSHAKEAYNSFFLNKDELGFNELRWYKFDATLTKDKLLEDVFLFLLSIIK